MTVYRGSAVSVAFHLDGAEYEMLWRSNAAALAALEPLRIDVQHYDRALELEFRDVSDRRVRTATPEDGEACAAIYAAYVTGTAISFETVPPSAAEMSGRIARALERHAWLILEDGGGVVGYAYATEHRARAAYRWACEVGVYLEPGLRRTGLARRSTRFCYRGWPRAATVAPSPA